MIVNAALSGKKLTTADQLATQKDLLKKVNAPAWKGPLTYATRGVTLDELGPIIESSLKAYGVTPVQIETVHTDQVNEGTQKKLHETLVQVENSNNQFMAVNFDQAVYTNDMEVGHIAAVGAYDAQKKQVLILDPDRKWFEPYWVSEEIFLKGMATLDAKQAKKHRGYIRIKLPEHQ
jgi:hypothetical protein